MPGEKRNKPQTSETESEPTPEKGQIITYLGKEWRVISVNTNTQLCTIEEKRATFGSFAKNRTINFQDINYK